MGGRISVTSEVGVGSSFVVQLPPAPDGVVCAEEPPPRKDPLAPESESPAVLADPLEAQEPGKPR
jgi:hypothetical protein